MSKLWENHVLKPLIQEFVDTRVKGSVGIVHVVFRNKGLLINKFGTVHSYPSEFYEGKWGGDGCFYLRHRDSDVWELVYDGRWFYPCHGLREENGNSVRFRGEYPWITPSVSLSKRVILLATLCDSGKELDVLLALGRRRIAMIRLWYPDRDIDFDNLYLHIYYRHLAHPEKIPGLVEWLRSRDYM